MGRPNKLVASLVAILIALAAAYGGMELSDGSGDQTESSTSAEINSTFSPHGKPGPEGSPASESPTTGSGSEPSAPEPGVDAMAAQISDPEQAAAVAGVLGMIGSGAPLPYDQDGAVFENREGNLPDLSSADAYHEFTVPTPGSPDRGARRLVISTTGLVYYTADHYETFTLLNG